MGVEAIGSIGSAMGSVLRKFGPEIKGVYLPKIVNEGSVAPSFLENTMPLAIGKLNPVQEIKFNEPLSALSVIAEAERILAPARIPESKVEPMVLPRLEQDPLPQIIISPALEPAIQPAQAVAIQPALREQQKEEAEKVVEAKEEIEESSLKDVVDEEVLNIRLEEFGSAADIAGSRAKREGLDEIDGKEIVERIPAETEVNRSGLIKKRGPDGSREETIGEVASRKFGAVKEAKEQIAAIIAQKVPVKRAKEGRVVGYEAVARVLKYQKTLPVDRISFPN